jgi:teichuronic acid biosynthesis glycosyltransferase TuaC
MQLGCRFNLGRKSRTPDDACAFPFQHAECSSDEGFETYRQYMQRLACLNEDVGRSACQVPNQMRVLTFTSLFPNKVTPTNCIFVHQRMSHFARRRGNEVVAVAPVPYVPSWLPGSEYESFRRVPYQEQLGNLTTYHPRYPIVPRVSMPLHGWLMFLGSISLVRRLHREQRFDFIDAHYVYPDGFAAVLIGKCLGLPVIVSARGTDINLFPTFLLIRPMIRWTLQHVSGAISVCTPLQDAMLRLGLPPEKARVIGNGIDLERFRPVDSSMARRRLQLPEEARILVSVGGLIERKGFHFLIPALAKILPQHPTAKLCIIGEGPWRNKLESIISQHGLNGSVWLRGSQPNEELKFWYSAADVSCLTSSREGWPNVILESMACGTPVLATRVWGVPEVIVSPKLGVMVDQSVESIANGLDLALKKSWDRETIKYYAQQRTWDVVAAEVEEFFQSRLNGNS